MANSRQIVALNVGSQRVSMGVFSKTNKNDLILDRYATRLIVLDPSAEGMRLAKVGEAVADLVQELRVKGGVANYSVSGQSVFIRFVKLPALDDTDVEQLIGLKPSSMSPSRWMKSSGTTTSCRPKGWNARPSWSPSRRKTWIP